MKYQLLFLTVIILLGFFLRFVDVSNDPPGLYSDEVSIGYNAYSVLTTGKDQYGVSYPLWFKAFGEYKMPVYIYVVASSMALFGKTEFAIRFPSVIAGTLTILILYLFLNKLVHLESDEVLKKKLKYLPLLASFLLAISAWHLQFSRGGFEVTLGTLFYILGCYFYLLFRQKRNLAPILLSLIFFIFAIYTYDTFRILTPLALLYIAYDQRVYKYKRSIPLIIFTIILLLPVIFFSLTMQGIERFDATSAFSQFPIHTILGKIFIYPLIYSNNYFSFFSFDFLFSFGDGIGRHQVENFGEIYRWQIPFFFTGIYFLLKTKRSIVKFTTFLLFLTTPLAGAVAVPSPHALRSLPSVIPCIIFISVGILFLLQKIKSYKYKVTTIIIICIFALFEFTLYLQYYYINYPQENLPDWGAGYKQLILATGQVKNKYKYIVIDSSLQYASVYFPFYDNSIKFIMVSPNWVKPNAWGKDKVLYIRPYFGHKNGKNVIENIYLPKKIPEIFAQFLNVNK